jgi:hypothetical protein
MAFTWYLFPLAFAISFVWTASRYEMTSVIVQRSISLSLKILAVMAVILLVLFTLSYRL